MGIIFSDAFDGTVSTTLPSHSPDVGPAWEDCADINEYLYGLSPSRNLRLDGSGRAVFEAPSTGVNLALNAARSISGAATDSAKLTVTFRAISVGADGHHSSSFVAVGNSFETTGSASLYSNGKFAGVELYATNGATYDVDVSLWAQDTVALDAYETWTMSDVSVGTEIVVEVIYDKTAGTVVMVVDGTQRASVDISTADPIVFSDLYAEIRNASEAAPQGWAISQVDYDNYGDAGGPLTDAEWNAASLRFYCDLETPGGTVRVPITSWQATLRVTESNYAQIAIPAPSQYMDAISTATEFAVYMAAYDAAGSHLDSWPMFRAPAETLSINSGPFRETATLYGYWTGYTAVQNPTHDNDRTMRGIQTKSETGTALSVRCSIDRLLRPAQRAYVDGRPIIVRSISYYATAVFGAQAYMDISGAGEVFTGTMAAAAAASASASGEIIQAAAHSISAGASASKSALAVLLGGHVASAGVADMAAIPITGDHDASVGAGAETSGTVSGQ